MSGICGFVSLDGAACDAGRIGAVALRLERRGPDGTHVWHDGPASLGHCLLATTPEALLETLPWSDPGSRCTITADARLDNRADLIDRLGLALEARVIGDGELILAAYLEWGEDCARHLLGDFAFAIWDPRSASLFAARDQVGLRQLIYRYGERRHFLFATEVTALLACPALDAPLNQARIVDYLGNMESADLGSTFFEGLARLPPAHWLRVDAEGLSLRQYWQLAPQPELCLDSDEAYEAAFITLFTQAVQCRLRSAGPVGAMLSGGIDSNAVAAVAATLLEGAHQGRLATFSAIGPDRVGCIESRAIMTATAAPCFAPTLIDHGALGALEGPLIDAAADAAEPFDANMVLVRAVYLAAQRAGIKVVLDGATSDGLFASDFHEAFLVREGRWRALWREADGLSRFWGPDHSRWRILAAAVWQAWAPFPLRAWRFWRGRRSADRAFLDLLDVAAPDIDRESALARRRSVQQRDLEQDKVDCSTRRRSLGHPNAVVARERYDRVAAAAGVEPRDPFCDLRLIEFCLSLPRDQLQREGWPKWILRRAMRSSVPRQIVWRRGRQHLGMAFNAALLRSGQCAAEPAQSPPAPAKSMRPEILFLSTWFAAMHKAGWSPGSVTAKGMTDDER